MWSTAKTRLSRLVAAPQVTFLHIVVEGYWMVAPCGRSFTRRANLQRHESGCRPKPFVCDVCRRSFGWKRNLDEHKKKSSAGLHRNRGQHQNDAGSRQVLMKTPFSRHRPEKCMMNSRVICKNVCSKNGRLYRHTWSTAQSRHVITGG